MKAPFPYFGGKSRVANIVNKALAGSSYYIEPFAGSLAVLLDDNNAYSNIIINDIDYFLINFWRSIKYFPEETYKHTQYPITEIDLHSRHKYLVSLSGSLKDKIKDESYCDPHIAGWWIWGKCASVGNNWLQSKGLNALPAVGGAGHGIQSLKADPLNDFNKLSSKLSNAIIKCGDWKDAITNLDNVSIFLDPPYDLNIRHKVYTNESDIYDQVFDWAIENESNKTKIVICGYEGRQIPYNWSVYNWSTNGGYANINNAKKRGKENSSKEMIYFSPSCENFNKINID